MSEQVYLTSRLVGERLRVGADRIRQLARAGRLRPSVVTASGVRLFTLEEIERYEREQRRVRSGAAGLPVP